jgi:death on curing protein
MAADFLYFDIHYAVKLHDWIIENSGGFPGSNNLSLLESALEHIQNDLFYPKIHH